MPSPAWGQGPVTGRKAARENADDRCRRLATAPSERARDTPPVDRLNAYFGDFHAIHDISVKIPEKKVTAVIGPSGCGKSTFLRCLNRMHELSPGAAAKGRVMMDGVDIYDRAVDPVRLRRH